MQLLEVVQLTVDLPERHLERGAVGTIVYVFEQPTLAYEVEFADAEGRTTAQVALLPEQIGPVAGRHLSKLDQSA